MPRLASPRRTTPPQSTVFIRMGLSVPLRYPFDNSARTHVRTECELTTSTTAHAKHACTTPHHETYGRRRIWSLFRCPRRRPRQARLDTSDRSLVVLPPTLVLPSPIVQHNPRGPYRPIFAPSRIHIVRLIASCGAYGSRRSEQRWAQGVASQRYVLR